MSRCAAKPRRVTYVVEPSARALPPATAYADLADVKAVPISEAGRERYAHFLTLPKPRAFVVYEDGNWRFYSKDPEAMTKALDYCAREGRRCWLYAGRTIASCLERGCRTSASAPPRSSGQPGGAVGPPASRTNTNERRPSRMIHRMAPVPSPRR